MKVTLKRRDVVMLWNSLNSLQKKEFDFKIAYAISRNKQYLKSEVEALEEAVKPSSDFETYDKERIELLKSHAKKDENDNPIVIKTQLGEEIVPKNRATFDKELKVLRKQYSKVIEAQDLKIKQRDESLKEEIELELHAIKQSSLETMNLTVSEMDAFIMFLEEDSGPSDPVVLKDVSKNTKKR